MKTIYPTKLLTTYKGDPIKTPDGIDCTVGFILAEILSSRTSNPHLAYQLAKKFATEESVDLKAEEVVFVKKEVSASQQFGSMILGQLIEILEAKDAPVATETTQSAE